MLGNLFTFVLSCFLLFCNKNELPFRRSFFIMCRTSTVSQVLQRISQLLQEKQSIHSPVSSHGSLSLSPSCTQWCNEGFPTEPHKSSCQFQRLFEAATGLVYLYNRAFSAFTASFGWIYICSPSFRNVENLRKNSEMRTNDNGCCVHSGLQGVVRLRLPLFCYIYPLRTLKFEPSLLKHLGHPFLFVVWLHILFFPQNSRISWRFRLDVVDQGARHCGGCGVWHFLLFLSHLLSMPNKKLAKWFLEHFQREKTDDLSLSEIRKPKWKCAAHSEKFSFWSAFKCSGIMFFCLK